MLLLRSPWAIRKCHKTYLVCCHQVCSHAATCAFDLYKTINMIQFKAPESRSLHSRRPQVIRRIPNAHLHGFLKMFFQVTSPGGTNFFERHIEPATTFFKTLFSVVSVGETKCANDACDDCTWLLFYFALNVIMGLQRESDTFRWRLTRHLCEHLGVCTYERTMIVYLRNRTRELRYHD